MIDVSTLPLMDMEQLKATAKAYNLPVHPREGAAKLVAKITAAHNAITPKQPVSHEKPVFALKQATQEEITEEAKKYADKGMELRFTEDNCWHVRCKGAEDSGTVYQELKVIARKIQEVARGARNPRGLKAGEAVMLTA